MILGYLKEGIGYPCEGHSIFVVSVCCVLDILTLSPTFTLGATLPTGSVRITKYSVLNNYSFILNQSDKMDVGIGSNFSLHET